jgi:signal transduction histidine kinase
MPRTAHFSGKVNTMSAEDVTLPAFGATQGRQPQTASGTRHISEVALGAFIVLLSGIIFAFDVVTPSDHVSICFLYAIPLFLTVFGQAQPVYLYAALATALSALGILFLPPDDIPTVAFYANRAIAVAALWIVAGLLATRKKAEALTRANLEEETRKAEYRRRFLDVLSHEIGTSLTTIDGQAFRLRKLAAAPKPSDISVRAEKIRQAVQHIKAIVQRVQLASEAGQRTLRARRMAVNLHALIGEAVQQARDSQPAPPIEIDIAGLPRTVRADPDMLKQVIDNLLSNAIKYSPPDAPIRIAGRGGDEAVTISVADRGRGIPEDEQKMLFGPYYRARNSRGVHGAGIGLYVCERYIASHGGTIDIDSKLDQGTTVTVRLPTGTKTPSERDGTIPDPVH